MFHELIVQSLITALIILYCEHLCLSPHQRTKESCLIHLYIPGGAQYANVARIKGSVYLVTFMYFLCEEGL